MANTIQKLAAASVVALSSSFALADDLPTFRTPNGVEPNPSTLLNECAKSVLAQAWPDAADYRQSTLPIKSDTPEQYRFEAGNGINNFEDGNWSVIDISINGTGPETVQLKAIDQGQAGVDETFAQATAMLDAADVSKPGPVYHNVGFKADPEQKQAVDTRVREMASALRTCMAPKPSGV